LVCLEQEIVDVLQVLKKEAKITEAVLRVRLEGLVIPSCLTNVLFLTSSQESKAGLAVGKLRSHAAKDVSELAKEIVRAWKTAVDKEKQAAGTHSKGAAKSAGMRNPSFANDYHINPSGFPSSSRATQIVKCIGSLNGGRLEQWRPYSEERRREYIYYWRQNAGQVHRNAL